MCKCVVLPLREFPCSDHSHLSSNWPQSPFFSEIGALKRLFHLSLEHDLISGTLPFSLLHNASTSQIKLQGNLLTGIETRVNPSMTPPSLLKCLSERHARMRQKTPRESNKTNLI